MRSTGHRFLAGIAAAAFALAGATAVAQTVIKVGHDQPDRSTHHQAALKWKDLVEARTNGQVQVRLFPAMTLGSGTQMVEQTQAGALEVSILPTAWVAPLAPSVQVLDLPFLFPDRATLYRVIDGPTGTEIMKPLNKVNIEGVTFFESGFKQFTGNFPIREPKDYQGHKIRTMPAQVIQEQFKALARRRSRSTSRSCTARCSSAWSTARRTRSRRSR
jgi:C4-dicarboxylate-binding protein DctP